MNSFQIKNISDRIFPKNVIQTQKISGMKTQITQLNEHKFHFKQNIIVAFLKINKTKENAFKHQRVFNIH